MADPQRARKMADRIQEIVARRLDKGIRDPRLGFVTITDVQVTGDLQHASVFYTVYGSDEERQDTAAALKSATGMLRSEVGKNITARLTPTLEFIADAVPENAAHIDALLAEARDRDAAARAQASAASYAGDADPYRHDDDEDDDEDSADVVTRQADPGSE
ncbi:MULTISPECIES: 30S ribosome-binding factor RbfA [unclassified Curtobacterium]|uniref:30S ribosome-binding factor RbfA n=1 Tax=unclassified Curtobacterium TaxID=257496 RepID=UPI000DA9568A|nr:MULTISPECIES: 30S ribosome-binding factor RbfA [unclassified Curtobacterium]PZE28840.1 30S ribosome-binding factor RbfA [Curtobacterium sp. MCBD17_028]PZE77192.1 30S ribosome-binding factor RbfA [Curtobacterium sp. MCBD17_019]